MSNVTDLRIKRENINAIEKLSLTQQAVALLDQRDIAVLSITIDSQDVPIIKIEKPADAPENIQQFGAHMEMAEVKRFGRVICQIIWDKEAV